MTKDTIKAYAMGLNDVPADALEIGAREMSKTSKWFPALSELREEALKYGATEQLDDGEARKMAYRLLMSWHLCTRCWRRPCVCHPELMVEDGEVLELEVTE